MIAYAATTDRITVTVQPAYLDGASDFMEMRFVFGYAVRIENNGLDDVQLLRRRWTIREAGGRLQDVEGEGVVGEQPLIAPGEAHEYSSGVVIESFDATMEGTYLMQRADGPRFRVDIPRFHLHAAAN